MDYNGGHRGASQHDHRGQGADPTRPYAHITPSPQAPTYPPHMHPCPQLNQNLANSRPVMFHPTSGNATEHHGPAQANRTPAFRYLPNPLNTQGITQQGRTHARTTSTASNAELHLRSRDPFYMAPPAEQPWARHASLDGSAPSASHLTADRNSNPTYGGLSSFNVGSTQPRIGGHSRERASSIPHHSPSTSTSVSGGASALSPSPRRRPVLSPHHQRPTNSNGSFTEQSSTSSGSLSASDRRRARQHRLRRGLAHSVDDDRRSPEMSSAFLSEFWPHHGREHQPQQQMLSDDEEELYVQAHRAHRQHVNARKSASQRVNISSLESLRVDDLPEDERMCPICYNDYGVQGPEGINEAPLRIPRCKHVFGDHCIKKWLVQKGSCPYCRDTVPGHSDGERSESTASQNRTSRSSLFPEAALVMSHEENDPAGETQAQAQLRWLQNIQLQSLQHRTEQLRTEQLRQSSSRPHPPPSDSDDQPRRTRQRLSAVDSSQQAGISGEGQAARTGDTLPAPQSAHGTHQNVHRVPEMDTLPPLMSPEQRIREMRLAAQPQVFTTLNFLPGHPGHPGPQARFQALDPYSDSNRAVGAGFPYLAANGMAPTHLPSGVAAGHMNFGNPLSYPPNFSMQPDIPAPPHGGVAPIGTTPMLQSPNRIHATEAAAAYEPRNAAWGASSMARGGEDYRPQNSSAGAASVRGRIW